MAVCGQPILDSHWRYDGPAGTYTARDAPDGLPTFGSPGSDFPDMTRLVVVPAGNNTAAASAGVYIVNHTVVYFEPGVHRIENGMFTGHNSAYVGGYTATAVFAARHGGRRHRRHREGRRPAGVQRAVVREQRLRHLGIPDHRELHLKSE